MDKVDQNVDLLEKILSDIKNEFKKSSVENLDNMRLKEIKAKFNLCIQNVEMENFESTGFEKEDDDLDAEKEKYESTSFGRKDNESSGFENKSEEFCNVHLSEDELENNDLDKEKEDGESTGFENKNVDELKADSTGLEKENTEDDCLNNVSENFETRQTDEERVKDEVIEKDVDDDTDVDTPVYFKRRKKAHKSNESNQSKDEGLEDEKKNESIPSNDEMADTPESSFQHLRKHNFEEGSAFDEDKEEQDDIKVKYKFTYLLLKKRIFYNCKFILFSQVKKIIFFNF